MKYSLAWLLLLSLSIHLSCSHFRQPMERDVASIQAAGGWNGIWFVQGSNSVRGPYNGEIELRRTSDGTYDVVRIITYINFYFEGFKVQEVWTGKAASDDTALLISYNLKQADHIVRLGSLRRTPEEFKNNLNVLSRYTGNDKGLQTQFEDRKSSSYTELLTTRRPLEEKTLWKDERTKFDAKGPKMPLSVRGVMKVFKMKIGYEKDPLVKSYSQRPEYKNEQPYIIFDPTDFDFYRKNPQMIRVANKITDPISMTETLAKRNAYAPTLEEKAVGYEKNTQDRHINLAGMLSNVHLGPQNEVAKHTYDGDSAIWTGVYVGSQAMRYLVTKEPQALENVKKSMKGTFALMDITGNPKEFARTLMVYDPNEALKPKWHRGTGKFSNLIWLEGGNNDMVKGLTHSFMWASLVVPETDSEIWNELREKSLRLIDLEIMEEKPQNAPAALGLAALIHKDAKLKEKYVQSYDRFKVKMSGYSFDTNFYWHGSADWSGINLGTVGAITNIMIADRLGEINIRKKLQRRLMDEWVVYSPSQRHLLTLVTYGFSYTHGARSDMFKKESSEAQFKAALEQALWGLREIPYPRPAFDVDTDHSLKPEWCMSPIPRIFWKAFKNPMPPMTYFYQGLYNYPAYEQDAYDNNFLWKTAAFMYKDGHDKNVEYSGVDFLYAYWVARYAGILQPGDKR